MTPPSGFMRSLLIAAPLLVLFGFADDAEGLRRGFAPERFPWPLWGAPTGTVLLFTTTL